MKWKLLNNVLISIDTQWELARPTPLYSLSRRRRRRRQRTGRQGGRQLLNRYQKGPKSGIRGD